MNLREIINGARPDSAEPYYKLDREERHLAAILFHLLQQPPNREILLKHAGCEGPAWEIAEEQFGIYFEYSYPRDLWNSLSLSEEANKTKKRIIVEMLRKCGATLGLLDQLSQFETQH